MNRSIYSLLFHLALPLIGLRLAWRAWRAPAYSKRIAERFAFGLPALQPGGIWVHAVSVGESIAAAPMIDQLLARYPQLPITVTCMTPTGSERIQAMFAGAKYQGRVQHCYMPYDLPWAAARFLKRLQPKLAVIMETELWPNHIHQCARRGIAVALANARLSERSARGYARFAKLTAPMLAELDLIAVQTETEAQRFRALGARAHCVEVTGSIKFDLHIDPALRIRAAELRQQWGAENRAVWIAASTHEGEDEQVLQAHSDVLRRDPNALLILVPRHPERFNSVFELVQREGFTAVRRSSEQLISAEHQVLLGDTMGELLFLYALADLAFVGGSLIASGGHNPLEPAALGKPILMGPHVFNFLEITALLRGAGALLDVSSGEQLAAELKQLWQQPEQADAMRQAGLTVMQANQGALQRLLDGLARLLAQ